jgi:chloramphenicol 3-O phosphotransferase
MAGTEPGHVIVLNGAPRSGKTSIARAMQQSFDGVWMNLGVDGYMAATPERLWPGIGLRPGGERPDLEPHIVTMYAALYDSVAAHSRRGLNVVVDVGHHDSYAEPRGILRAAAAQHPALPVLLVGVRCDLDEIMRRRGEDGPAPAPVQRWQVAVHDPGIYDLEVDTTSTSADECAETIRRRLTAGPPPTAWSRLVGAGS